MHLIPKTIKKHVGKKSTIKESVDLDSSPLSYLNVFSGVRHWRCSSEQNGMILVFTELIV